jgi:diketogulonate reductase-like aldo/keto reductase
MRSRLFGSTGVRVPIVGQGTWLLEQDHARSIAAIRRGLDLGMTHIDTAEMYGAGQVEELIGEAITGRREQVFLASKVLPSNASYQGTLDACERSLERLGTDWLDLYLLHWPSQLPLEETVKAFEQLVRQGKIRFWGLSNFDVSELEQAIAIAGEGRIACDQVLFNVEERYAEQGLLGFCQRNGIALVAYSPLGAGIFPSNASHGGRVLHAIARARGVEAQQIALAFLLRHPDVFAIPKAGKIAHVEANAAAADLQLSPDEIARLEAAFPTRPEQESLPIL